MQRYKVSAVLVEGDTQHTFLYATSHTHALEQAWTWIHKIDGTEVSSITAALSPPNMYNFN